MASKIDEMEQENVPQDEEEGPFNHEKFLSRACQRKYDELLSKTIVRERGINMDKVERKMPDFYRRLVESGWICFALPPVVANYAMVLEFYANATRTNFQEALVTTVRGVQVSFNPEIINAVYGLPDADNEVYKERFKERGNQWLVDKFHDRVTPNWVILHKGVDSYDFTAEATAWLSIICARIMPSTNDSDVTPERALVIAAIMDGMPVNVGAHIF